MSNINLTIKLKCFFCDSELEGDNEKEYFSGDMIECQECGEFNDYDSLIEVAKEEGKTLAVDYINKELLKAFKK